MRAGGAIVLVGFMGAGKTTVTSGLAQQRGLRASDTDQLIEAGRGQTVAEIFATEGESRFRALEEETACDVLARARAGEVVALGGGAVGSARVRAALAEHLVVWLDVEPESAWQRASGSGRPLAADRASFDALHAERTGLYAQLADAVVPAGAIGVPTAAGTAGLAGTLGRLHDALEQLRPAPSGTRLLWASAASGDYPVWVGRGVLGAPLWPLARPPARRFCVTDETVAPLWLAAAGELDGVTVVPAGERSKTLAMAERVWRELVAHGMTRADHLVALGGGVVGDLAGFCAATYQRGVPVVQVPTTLAAQVDSAYGGKTGIDLPEAKNYVGAYHQPAAVLVDPLTLETLPAEEASAGYAEVIKTALIAGGTLWDRIAADQPVDDDVIFDCARCKLAIVAQDERDDGRRQVLNLGHTVGHAIETVTEYRRYRHGEAVALGLLASLSLSGQDALRAQVRELLDAHGLPTRLRDVDTAAVAAATERDKKRLGGAVPFVLVDAPGAVRANCEVGREQLESALAELAA